MNARTLKRIAVLFFFASIVTIASTKLNEVTFMNMMGRKYKYSDLFHVNENEMVLFKTHYRIPATYESFVTLFLKV